MAPIIASLSTCVCRKPLRPARQNVSGRFACFLLGLFVSIPAGAAEGIDVADEEMYSDDVTLTTFDGEPLDINGDGFVDLVIASNSSDTALRSRYYPGNGDATFGAPVLLTTGGSSEIVGADVNGDMFTDLIQGIRDRNSHLYLGTPPAEIDAGNHINILDEDRVLAVAVGDLDNDNDLDIVTATGHPGGEPSTPDNLAPNRFYLNTTTDPSSPSFGAGTDISADMDDTRSIALADMDNDGDLDVIAGNDETTPGSNRVYLNEFDGSTVSFADGVDFGPEDDQTGKLLVDDLNDDGLPDVVTLNFIAPAGTGGTGSPGINRFFLNETSAGTFALGAATDISADANMSSGGALADFDGDGDLDIAVANLLDGSGQTPRNRLYLNQFVESGSVSFVGSDISADEHQSRELAAGDIDEDGDIDIVVANQPLPLNAPTVSGRDRIYLNNGTSAPFAEEALAFSSEPVTEATVDVAYTYDVSVTDPGDDPITMEAPTLPAWLTFTDNGDGTATLTGTPTAGDAGEHAVSLEASNGTDSANQDFTITVAEAPAGNTAPEFTSTAVTEATEGEAYSYEITTSDAESDAITLTAPTMPGWLTFTDNGDGTATLSGTPGADDVGDHAVSVEAADGTDATAQDFTIVVAAAGDGGGGGGGGSDGGGGGGGGGSLGGWSLLALIGAIAAGRRRRIAA